MRGPCNPRLLFSLPPLLSPPLQPQLFLPHAAIASLELMRAGGASATFDLVVHLKQNGAKPVEFGMIGRGEVGAIEGVPNVAYFHMKSLWVECGTMGRGEAGAI